MHNLFKNKKVFFILMILICIGLFYAAKGMQNYYFNSKTDNQKTIAENNKNGGNRNDTENDLQKAENNVSDKNSPGNNTVKKSEKPSVSSKNVNKNNSSSNTTGSVPKSQTPAAPEKINFTIIDEVNGQILAKAYLGFDGKTVGEVTRAFMDSQKTTYEDDNGYMAMMYNIWEKDKGPYSGWCFYVNGVKPSIGENSKILKKGDILVWKYLKDGISQ